MSLICNTMNSTDLLQKLKRLRPPQAADMYLKSLTRRRGGEDFFRDVELILCHSGPVFHSSPAFHGEVDITGNC